MKYKGYTGVVEFDEESGSLYGRVIGLRDVITFQGESVAEVTQAFRDSVDDYLEFCAKRGRDPEKPYSGQFVLRIDPQLHRAISHAAEELGVSLNSLVEDRLADAFLVGGGPPKGAAGRGRSTTPGARTSGRATRPRDVAETPAKTHRKVATDPKGNANRETRKGRGVAKGSKD